MVEFHQLAAAIYLAAGIGALVGVVLPAPRMSRGAAWGLALGAVIQTFAFATIHSVNAGLPITSLPVVVSLMAWMSVQPATQVSIVARTSAKVNLEM